MTFEWDENKRQANLAKHGIDFADAKAVFRDEHKFVVVDDRTDYGETRTITVGQILDELITAVISTDRNNNIRIISARRANKKERKQYYGNR
ncbi:MAG: BrnT family toxin [Prevotellaceae bacterium]|jgi:uncharacterized DUF497 family protein|nr:BrnT family toxin [Prevotellaceae bacterium]